MSSEERRAKNAERQRSWRTRNPERANAIAAAGRQRNRAKVTASWKAYYEKNKAELYKKKKAYLGRNGEKLSQWKRADYERHRESYIARARKRWREKNGECRAYEAKRYGQNKAVVLARHRDYVDRNREKIRAYLRFYAKSPRGRAVRAASDRRCAQRAARYKKAWALRNRQKILINSRIRRETDMSFAIGICLRTRMAQALRKYQRAQRESVTTSMRRFLGCTMGELVKYLECRFLPGMSWENRKLWHIDHIRPLASFDLTDIEQQHLAFHYTNLQPLWAGDNIRKGARPPAHTALATTLPQAPASQRSQHHLG